MHYWNFGVLIREFGRALRILISVKRAQHRNETLWQTENRYDIAYLRSLENSRAIFLEKKSRSFFKKD